MLDEEKVNPMSIHYPSRESVDVAVYTKVFDDGRRELSCFYGANSTGWAPMVAVWAVDANDPKNVHEEMISIGGMTFAYCTSNDLATDFDGLQLVENPVDARDWALEMMVAGILYERVKDF